MPTDQKLQFYKIQLEKQNNRIKMIENEKNILNSKNEKLQIQMVRINLYTNESRVIFSNFIFLGKNKNENKR